MMGFCLNIEDILRRPSLSTLSLNADIIAKFKRETLNDVQDRQLPFYTHRRSIKYF